MFNNTTDGNTFDETRPAPRARACGAHAGAGPLSTAHIRPRVVWRAGASLLQMTKGGECAAVGGGKRSRIKGFSVASRRRLMRMIGAIRRDAELPNFVTLTYPGEFPTVERAKRDLKVFLQRLARRFPGAGCIWKLEPQQRGAPHYHMLVWGVGTWDLLLWTVRTWYEIAGNGDENHIKFHVGQLQGSRPCVERVRSFRGVWAYASKYLGKTFEVAEWGSQWTGRFWGVVGREAIPFGELRELEISYRTAVVWMRYQRRFSGIRARSVNSLTIFCDADQWAGRVLWDYDHGV